MSSLMTLASIDSRSAPRMANTLILKFGNKFLAASLNVFSKSRPRESVMRSI